MNLDQFQKKIPKISINHFLIFLLVTTVFNIFYVTFFFNKYSYLPLPFFFDINDSFMDFFNVLYWSYGGQDPFSNNFSSIYSPLIFFIMQFFTANIENYSFSDSFALRDHYITSAILVIVSSIFLIFLSVFKNRSWDIFSNLQKISIILIFIFSFHFLTAAERGNLVLLAIYPLSQILNNNKRISSIFGVLLNIKFYFLLMIVIFFNKDSFLKAILSVLYFVIIFVFFGVIMEHSFYLAFDNIYKFFQIRSGNYSFRELLAFPTSFLNFNSTVNSEAFSNYFINKYSLDYYNTFRLIFNHITAGFYLLLLLFFLNTILYVNKNFFNFQKALFSIILLIISLGFVTGGYSIIFLFPFTPYIVNFKYKNLYFSLIAFLFIPFHLIHIASHDLGYMFSFLGSAHVEYTWHAGVNIFINPIVIFLLMILINYEIITDRR